MLCIVQAISSSKRLPDKIFKKIDGKSVIERVLIRLKKSKEITKIVFATSNRNNDNRVENFCLNNKRSTLREAAVLVSNLSNIKLRVLSTETGLQFYTGHHLLDTPPGYSNLPYTPFSGLCLEPQGWPDAPNKENFPSVFLPANTLYQQIIYFEFTKN